MASTISSASTTAQITAAYLDNCSYFEDESATKARAFVTACAAMLSRGMRVLQNGEERLELDPQTLRLLMQQAQEYAGRMGGVSTSDKRARSGFTRGVPI